MKTHSWGTKIVKKDGNEMTRNFQIQIPVLAAVGRYVIITELIVLIFFVGIIVIRIVKFGKLNNVDAPKTLYLTFQRFPAVAPVSSRRECWQVAVGIASMPNPPPLLCSVIRHES